VYVRARAPPYAAPWLTVAGLAVPFARLSDVYGRKALLLTAWVLFTAFSIGCAVSRSMLQLCAAPP
jgi:MFS family permease